MKKGIAGFTLMMLMTFSAFVWAGNGVERGSAFAWGEGTQDLHDLKKRKVEEALRKSCPGLLAGQSNSKPVQIVRFKARKTRGSSSAMSQQFVVETIPSYSRKARVNVVLEADASANDSSARVVSSSAPGLCSSN